MTREQVKEIVGTEEATDWVWPRVERALAMGYEPTVEILPDGNIAIGMTIVLSEGEEDDDA